MSFVMPNTIVNGSSRDARPVQANFAAVTSALQNDYIRKDGTIAMTGALELAGAPVNDDEAATKLYVDESIPPGVILDYGGDTAPNAMWALGLGQLVNKSDNPVLWGLFGDRFGTSTLTQFYLPNLQSRFVVGKGIETWCDVVGERSGNKDAIVPSHTHTASTGVNSADHAHTVDQQVLYRIPGGAGDVLVGAGTHLFFWGALGTSGQNGGATHTHAVTVNAFGSSATNANLPPYIVLNKIIRLG